MHSSEAGYVCLASGLYYHMFKQKGFTLIELIAVMVLVGFLAISIVPRFSFQDVNALAEVYTLESTLRYAQSRAKNDTEYWGVEIERNGYSLHRYSSDSTLELIPGVNSSAYSFPSGVTANAQFVIFDSRGRPVNKSFKPLSTPLKIAINGVNRNIIITPETGLIR